MSPSTAPRLQILAAALLFSTGGAVIKAVGLTGWQTAAVRSCIAALALALFMPAWRRGWTHRTWLVGCAYAATMILFVIGNRLTTTANIIFLQTTAPLWLLFIGPLLLRERIRAREIAVAFVLAAGMALFFVGYEEPLPTAPNPRLGNVLGAFIGLSWALTLAGLRWLGRGQAGGSSDAAGGAVIAGNVIAGLGCLPLALPFGPTAPFDWVLVGYLGVFQIGLAYVCMTRGVRRVPAFELSLLLILEPVGGVFWTWLVHGERPAGPALAGCAVILVATVWNAFARRSSRG